MSFREAVMLDYVETKKKQKINISGLRSQDAATVECKIISGLSTITIGASGVGS